MCFAKCGKMKKGTDAMIGQANKYHCIELSFVIKVFFYASRSRYKKHVFIVIDLIKRNVEFVLEISWSNIRSSSSVVQQFYQEEGTYFCSISSATSYAEMIGIVRTDEWQRGALV